MPEKLEIDPNEVITKEVAMKRLKAEEEYASPTKVVGMSIVIELLIEIRDLLKD